EGAEFTMSFGDGCRCCLTITARDEDAAEAFAVRIHKLLASAVAEFGTWAANHYGPRPWLPEAMNGMQPAADLIAAVVAATRLEQDGQVVRVVFTSKTAGAAALSAFRSLIQ